MRAYTYMVVDTTCNAQRCAGDLFTELSIFFFVIIGQIASYWKFCSLPVPTTLVEDNHWETLITEICTKENAGFFDQRCDSRSDRVAKTFLTQVFPRSDCQVWSTTWRSWTSWSTSAGSPWLTGNPYFMQKIFVLSPSLTFFMLFEKNARKWSIL